MDSGGAQKSGSCFFTRNLVCCHLQCCQRQGDMPHPCILATLKGHAISIHSKWLWKTSFGGMPQQPQRFIFTNLSLETLQLGFRELNGHKSCWTWPGSAPKPPRPSPEPCWTWPGPAPKPPGTFSGTFTRTLLNLTWLCTKASWNLLRNPGALFEPDLALHQSLLELYPEPCWTYQKALED